MAIPVPQAFPPIPEAAIASYNYTDIAEGTGITRFNCAANTNNSATSYILTTNTIYSNPLFTAVTVANNANYTKELDVDFDLSAFNTPKTVKGTAYLNIDWRLAKDGGTSATGWLNCIVKHWDGTTETTLATTSGATLHDVAAEATEGEIMENFKFTLPQTHFKKGDSIRLTVEGYGKCDGDTATLSIAHDPQNTNGGLGGANEVASTMTLDIPFRLDF